jgi:hypothetical protein
LVKLIFLALFILPAHARDLNGEYQKANPELHAWFDKLASKNGLCCSFADGHMVEPDDVDTAEDGKHYKVRIDGQWIVVPDEALVSVPNKFGQAVVWPFTDSVGHIQIRCFLPGAGI